MDSIAAQMSKRSSGRLILGGILMLAGVMALVLGAHKKSTSLVLVTVSGLRADVVTSDLMPSLASLPGGASGDEAGVSALVPSTAVGASVVLTGASPLESGIHSDMGVRLAPSISTIADRLAGRGYRTAAFLSEGSLGPMTGLHSGFERVFAPASPFDQAVMPDETDRLSSTLVSEFRSSELLAAFGSYVRGLQPGTPAFVWIHLSEPSMALRTEESAARESYRAAITQVDEAVGIVRATLGTSGLSGSFHLIVAALHGEALGTNDEMMHGLSLSSPVMDVPVRWEPSQALAGSAPLAGLEDIAGRALRAIGVDVTERTLSYDRVRWTLMPSRSYGWPDEAEVQSGGSWAPLSPTHSISSTLRLHRDADPPTQAERKVMLDGMRRATQAAVTGDVETALSTVRDLRRQAPLALAPRLLEVRVLLNLSRSEVEARQQEVETLLDELRSIARDLPSLGVRLDVARALASAGRKDDAIALVNDVIKAGGLSAGEQIAVSELFARLDMYEQAAEVMSSVAEMETAEEASELHEWIGDRLRRSANYYRARQSYELASRNPRQRTPNLLAKLADCYEGLGESERALETYAAAIAVDPSYRYPHLRAGEILLKLEREGAAVHAFVQSVRTTGDPVADALNRSRVLESYGLIGPAAAELAEVAGEGPAADRVETALGRLLATGGNLARSREILLGVLQKQPRNALARVNLARTLALAGDETGAIAELERAETHAGEDLTRLVANEPAFRSFGEKSPLALKASTFTGQGVTRGNRRARTNESMEDATEQRTEPW